MSFPLLSEPAFLGARAETSVVAVTKASADRQVPKLHKRFAIRVSIFPETYHRRHDFQAILPSR
jgi:hypothetical protein